MADGCTCPPAPAGSTVRNADKDCPVHGLHMLDIPGGFISFGYGDGISVVARTKEDADELHDRMLASRRRRSPQA